MTNCLTVGITARPTAADLVAERILVSHHASPTPSMSQEIEQ